MSDAAHKAATFKALHEGDRIFVMPNAWDRASARLLAMAGFEAVGTTSAGVNFSAGCADGSGQRDAMLTVFGEIATDVTVPCNGDIENGYGDALEAVAETIRRSIAAGMAGGNIEDYTGRKGDPLYEVGLATARIHAARAAIDASGVPFVLTARTDCYLTGHESPFEEATKRLSAYRDAGADVLYAPGIGEKPEIAALVAAVGAPVNVVLGRYARGLSVDDLAEAGVKRVSVGGALFLAAYGQLQAAAQELRQDGTINWTDWMLDRDTLRQMTSPVR